MRIHDPELLTRLHLRWRECVICGATASGRLRLSLHHISKHPRDDLEENRIMLCGNGVQGCHGAIEAGHKATCKLVASYVRRFPKRMAYLDQAHATEGADHWLQRIYGA